MKDQALRCRILHHHLLPRLLLLLRSLRARSRRPLLLLSLHRRLRCRSQTRCVLALLPLRGLACWLLSEPRDLPLLEASLAWLSL